MRLNDAASASKTSARVGGRVASARFSSAVVLGCSDLRHEGECG